MGRLFIIIIIIIIIFNRATPISSATQSMRKQVLFLLAVRVPGQLLGKRRYRRSRGHFSQYLRDWGFLYWFLVNSLGAGEGQCVSDVIIAILTFLSYFVNFMSLRPTQTLSNESNSNRTEFSVESKITRT